jgi:DNA-binding beta-propeller fold protein YncE
MPGFCQAPRDDRAVKSIRRGLAVSKPIRLSLALLTSLAAFATAPAAQARQLSPRTDSARAQFLRDGAPGAWRERAALAPFGDSFGSGSALVGSAPVGNGPGALAVDPVTHTAYVANGFNNTGPNAGGDTVSVIDTRRCDAHDVSHCQGPWPTITVGNAPSGIAIAEKTDTVYVINFGDNTVSVFNGATCNGEQPAGCGQTPVSVPVGSGPIGIFADPANDTVYIPNVNDQDVSMLDSATCNATDLAACPHTQLPVVNVGTFPDDVDVSQSSHTVYVATGEGVSVFDANTCNATNQSTCGSIGVLPGDPNGLAAADVDPANDTLYTANFDDTVSAFDLGDCNAADLSGCATDVPGTVTVPGASTSLWLAVDVPLHSVYVAYESDDVLAVVNTDVCSGSDPAGCASLSPPEIHTGNDLQMVRLDPETQTLYTANQDDSDVSVINATRCDAQTTAGCRPRAPEVPVGNGGSLPAADPAVNTVYYPNAMFTVSMIDTKLCNALHSAGCAQTPPTVTAGFQPSSVAVDPATHTVYVASFDDSPSTAGTVSVFDDRTCNATDQAGCTAVSTIPISGLANDIAVNPTTDTVYVATISPSGPNLILVFKGATCNAIDVRTCGQTPASVTLPAESGPLFSNDFVALDVRTNTVYATSTLLPPLDAPFMGDSVYMINGAHCDGSDSSGCGQAPATVTLSQTPSNPFAIPGQQPTPWGIAVDDSTDTVYTANPANFEGPGTVSVINGATCNGQNTSGCSQTPATAPAGFGSQYVAVDQLTNRVYATNLFDSSVTTINGNTCKGSSAGGCADAWTDANVGPGPGGIAVDSPVDTAYVADNEGVSVVPLNR